MEKGQRRLDLGREESLILVEEGDREMQVTQVSRLQEEFSWQPILQERECLEAVEKHSHESLKPDSSTAKEAEVSHSSYSNLHSLFCPLSLM